MNTKRPLHSSTMLMSPAPEAIGDRFIPARGGMNFEAAHYSLTSATSVTSFPFTKKENTHPNIPTSVVSSPAVRERYTSSLSGVLLGESKSTKILAYKHKAPALETYQNQMKTLYSANKKPGTSTPSLSSNVSSSTRRLPSGPERVLDAPGLRDDYYLNLLDWSVHNVLAVALGRTLYLWNATSSKIDMLFEMPEDEDSITSVSWMADGNTIAFGTSSNEVQLWDVTQSRPLRVMRGHHDRVSSLSWNRAILSSGSRDTTIINHDVRIAQNLVAQLAGHSDEVCGLKWSEDGMQLASGGNDNILHVWDEGRTTAPRFRLDHHTSAVKALAWCPWQGGLLASGGGTADRCIKTWNTRTGACLHSIDTGSQVCSLLWSRTHKELISSHGFPHHQLSVWKFPTMAKVGDLHGHTSRVLFTALSPDGETVASCASDERIRLWKVWPVGTGSSRSSSRKDGGASQPESTRLNHIR